MGFSRVAIYQAQFHEEKGGSAEYYRVDHNQQIIIGVQGPGRAVGFPLFGDLSDQIEMNQGHQ